ncbi:hypothetical protein SBOR_0826 [Sclerotinia borealis F-4128]|uniref:2EXR domain-containing protein n=1 Tax=Sclerotinia borealis (strain F-4128) TaxID=1432307 RepID=W9CPN4_SCLBF|nr:hypothetical protein SBOR_0826 [Sclerotinia borealis F-4128]
MSKLASAQVAISQGKLAVIVGFKPVSDFIKYDPSFNQQNHFPPGPRQSQRKFTLFLQLPTELQLLIWNHVLLDREARLIIVRSTNICAVLPGGEFETPVLYQATAYSDIPPTLQVCHLSRTEARRHYSLCFQQNLVHPVYFDPRKDFLVMEGAKALESFVDHGLRHEKSADDRSSRLAGIVVGNGWRGVEFL